MPQPTILVTGANGKLGRRVVELLLATGETRVIAGTRNPGTFSGLSGPNLEVRRVDFDDAAGLNAAFADIDRLLIVSTDAILEPGRRLRQHKAAVAAAIAAQVGHVVYTSTPQPEPGSPIPFSPDHYETEQTLAASTLQWTVLRNAWYTDSLLQSLPPRLASGRWMTSAREGRTAYVTREDCAQAAAAILLQPPSENARLDVTGPEALTNAEIAAVAADVLGKPLQVLPLTDEQLTQGLTAAKLPPFLVALLVAGEVNTRLGRAGDTSDAVERLTGRPATSIREFLEQHRDAFLPPATP